MKKLILVFSVFILALSTNAAGQEALASGGGGSDPIKPSFDCAKAKSRAEKLICSDNNLAKLDLTVHELHKKAMSAAIDQKVLADDSKEAWRWREDNCDNKNCVTEWFIERIHVLEDLVQNAPATKPRAQQKQVVADKPKSGKKKHDFGEERTVFQTNNPPGGQEPETDKQIIERFRRNLEETLKIVHSKAYFAYRDTPGDLLSLSGTLLLSRSPCVDKNAAKDKWYHAAIYFGVYNGVERAQIACWAYSEVAKDRARGILYVCYVGNENGLWVRSNECGGNFESSFADTASLPKRTWSIKP
ncbi:MAG: hypothetical protein LBE32_00985 [Burkholderiales bacterium]|nr:hypothetical protein [Burkholderiales bacterium]